MEKSKSSYRIKVSNFVGGFFYAKKSSCNGWYKYTSRFALPVYDGDGEVERYNVFQVIMIVRHAENGKMYLYDIMNIKKETSNLFQS